MENINKLIQIDKNIAFNILEFDKIKDSQTRNIIKSLLIYFSEQRELDLFGFQTLDPVKFSKRFHHSRQNLFRHIEKPLYLESKQKVFYKWDSYLENCLYLLASIPVFEEYRGEDENNIIVGLRNYIILNEIRCQTSKSKGKPKKTYFYKLDINFLTNLKRFFLNINVDLYLECRKSNMEDFYLQIMNLYNENRFGGNSSHTFRIEVLEKYFNVSHPNARMKKMRITKQLDKIELFFKKYNVPIRFVWIKEANQRYPYTLNVIWEIVQKEIKTKEKFKVLEKRNFVELKIKLREIYLINEQPFAPSGKQFGLWLKKIENKEIIKEFFLKVLEEEKTKHTYPSDLIYFNNFYSNFLKAENFNQMFEIH